jgi:hypothetical protein
MTFAHWKNIPVTRSRLLNPPAGIERVRDVGKDEVAAHFILDIPEGITREDAIATLHAKLVVSGGGIDETDGLDFEDKWPPEVRRQFDAGHGDRCSWLYLK